MTAQPFTLKATKPYKMKYALICFLLNLAVANAIYFFSVAPVSTNFLETAEWIFESNVTLPLTLDQCWDILTDDGAWEYWHPEVRSIENTVGTPGTVGSERTIVFGDWVIGLLVGGPFRIQEVFDSWENDASSDTRRYSMYYKGVTRPNAFTYSRGKEEFVCQRISDSETRFTRTVALDPGFLANMLSFIAYARLENVFEVLCPERLLESIEAGRLPRAER